MVQRAEARDDVQPISVSVSALFYGVLLLAASPVPTSMPAGTNAPAAPWWVAAVTAGISAVASIVVVFLQSGVNKDLAKVNSTLQGQQSTLDAQLKLDVGAKLASIQAGIDAQSKRLAEELGRQTAILQNDLQARLETVKSDLEVSQDVRKQQLDDARKKQQLLSLLRDNLAPRADGQVLWLADNASQKGVARKAALQKRLENNKRIWKETIYRLLVPLAAADMLGQDLRAVVPDARVASIRALLSCLLETYSSGAEIASLKPVLSYTPGDERPDAKVVGKLPAVELARYVVQHVSNLRPILATLQVQSAWTVVQESDYLSRFSAEPGFDERIGEVGAIFAKFHPLERPVTWRIIVTQLFVYRALEALMLEDSSRSSRSLVEALPAAPHNQELYDWRDRDLVTVVPSDSPLLAPFEPAKAFVLSRLPADV